MKIAARASEQPIQEGFQHDIYFVESAECPDCGATFCVEQGHDCEAVAECPGCQSTDKKTRRYRGKLAAGMKPCWDEWHDN